MTACCPSVENGCSNSLGERREGSEPPRGTGDTGHGTRDAGHGTRDAGKTTNVYVGTTSGAYFLNEPAVTAKWTALSTTSVA